tara:strand:+ start:1175 stop:1459 length:285 start_codon:yes stop_codon:yes gene_type:complete
MAQYNFKCKNCNTTDVVIMPVLEYLTLSSENALYDKECKKCNTVCEFIRIFNSSSSKISKSKEQIVDEAKEDARKIVNKIKLGDTKAMLDVYGE